VGEVTGCHYWDSDVVITGWSEVRTPWPMCKLREGYGRPRLLVDDELARAIRTESAAALMHWWGVGVYQVWKWRKAFGISHAGTPGSARLVQAAAEQGAEAVKAREFSEEEREHQRQQTIASGRNKLITPGYNLGPWWKEEEIALLGVVSDEEVAKQTGRSVDAVRRKRNLLGIAKTRDRRRRKDG
jgi:hypothetical protein